MEFLRGATALVVCWSLCFPAPLALAQGAPPPQAAATNVQPPAPATHRASYVSTQLQGDARILERSREANRQ